MNPSTSGWSDEQLMAWADGVLPADEVVGLEAAIEADADLANRAAAMQQTRALVQEAYAARAVAEPVPPALRAAVEDLVARDRVRREADRPRRGGFGAMTQWFANLGLSAAVAASLACGVIGFLIGQAGMQAEGPAPSAPAAARNRMAEAPEQDRARSAPLARESAPGPAGDRAERPPEKRPESQVESPAPVPSLPAPPPPPPPPPPAAPAAAADALGGAVPAKSLGRSAATAGAPSAWGARSITVGEPASPALVRLLDQLPGGAQAPLGEGSVAMLSAYRDHEGTTRTRFLPTSSKRPKNS